MFLLHLAFIGFHIPSSLLVLTFMDRIITQKAQDIADCKIPAPGPEAGDGCAEVGGIKMGADLYACHPANESSWAIHEHPKEPVQHESCKKGIVVFALVAVRTVAALRKI